MEKGYAMNGRYTRYRKFTIDTRYSATYGFGILFLGSAFVGDYAAFHAIFGDGYATLAEAKAAIDDYWARDRRDESAVADLMKAWLREILDASDGDFEWGRVTWTEAERDEFTVYAEFKPIDEHIWDTKIDGEWICASHNERDCPTCRAQRRRDSDKE